jgi:hypothetical protein
LARNRDRALIGRRRRSGVGRAQDLTPGIVSGDLTPALPRQAAEAVSIALDLVDVRVALFMQRPKQFAHALEKQAFTEVFGATAEASA